MSNVEPHQIFGNRINDVGLRTVNAGMDDLRRVLDRKRKTGQFDLILERTGDMDSGIEFMSTDNGIAILGCEDSLRGSFAFYYFDRSKSAEILTIGIHEVPEHALCRNFEDAVQVAESYFREGDLNRRFSWIIDISVGDRVVRGNLLEAGDNIPLEEFIARVERDQVS